MAQTKFRGVEYDIPDEFTNRELMEIEHVSGIPTSVVERGILEGAVHYSTLVAWTWVAIKRAGANVTLNALLDAPVGSITWIKDKPEEAEVPLGADAGEGNNDPSDQPMPDDDGTQPSPSSSE